MIDCTILNIRNSEKIRRFIEKLIINNNEDDEKKDDAIFKNYLNDFNLIKNTLSDIDDQLSKLEIARQNYSSLIHPSEEKKLTSEVEMIYSELKLNLQTITKNLEQLKNGLDQDRTQLQAKELEIIETKIATFYITLKEKVHQSHSMYQLWREAAKNKLKRQIENLDFDQKFSDNEIETMIEEDPGVMQKLISEQLCGKASAKLQYAAQDINEKCEGIKRLQRYIKELLEMLKELTQIVTIQSEKISSIAAHVSHAKEYTNMAIKNLDQAKKHANSSRSVE